MNSEMISELMEKWEADNGPVQTLDIRVSEGPRAFSFSSKTVATEEKPKQIRRTKVEQVLDFNRRNPKATVQEIAAHLKMNVDYARTVLNDHHIKTPLKKRDRPESSQRTKARTFLRNNPGMLTKDIAKELGISPTVIRVVAREMGYEFSRPKTINRVSPMKDRVIFELKNSDDSNLRIAEMIGCTTEYVRRARRELLMAGEIQ